MRAHSFSLFVFAPLALLAFSNAAPAQIVGGQWETLWQFDARTHDHLGISVSEAGDVDGDGTPDLVVGASNTASGGSAYVNSLDPFFHPDSGQGTGPGTLGGLKVPLSMWGPLTQLMLGGWTPPNLLNGRGILDADGDAQATILSDPGLARHLGRTIFLAAASFDPATRTGRLSSIVRYLTIVP